jgi:hypothetical protein
MARALVFTINGREYSAEPVKVDRKKLYGSSKTIALDSEGNECESAYAADFGTMILPQGGIGSGILSPANEWVERSSLVAIDADGNKAALLPSSFSAPNPLTKTVSETEFLDYDITDVYELSREADFCAAVGDKIWTFPYRFRDSYDSKTAFVFLDEDVVRMLLGIHAGIEMITLEQAAILDDGGDEEDDEDEEIDFSFA